MTARDLVIGACVAMMATLSACTGPSEAGTVERATRQAGAARAGASESAAGLAAFTVDTATVDVPLELRAQLYVEHDAVVVARSPGTVDSLAVELGDRVAAGQLLAKLESTDQEIALAGAVAQLENLERVAARARALTKFSGATVADSEQVEFQLRQANIAVRKARRDLELTRVAAPFDGVVSARFIRPRRYASIGDTLFRVSETAPLYARIRVPEASSPFVRVGDRASATGVDGARGVAVVVHAAPIIDAASGTREVVLRLATAAGGLVAGQTVRIQLGRERRRVVRAPRAAIAADGYALVVENGRTTLRPVTVGADLGAGYVEIVSGLSRGERLAEPGR